MALRFSTALRNKIASGLSWAEALQNGELVIYTGSQPANADTAQSGTELVRFTLSGGTYTAPTQCITKIALATANGTVDDITVGGGFDLLNSANVSVGANLTDGAANVAADINAKVNPFGITAGSNANDVWLYVPESFGAALNNVTCTANGTTTTATVNAGDNILGGANAQQNGVAAANGLNFQPAANGAIAKESTAWQANASANGTAGWFRYLAGGSNDSVTGTTELCFDGTVATSGGDLNLSSLTITANATQTINTFTVTVPAS